MPHCNECVHHVFCTMADLNRETKQTSLAWVLSLSYFVTVMRRTRDTSTTVKKGGLGLEGKIPACCHQCSHQLSQALTIKAQRNESLDKTLGVRNYLDTDYPVGF